MTFAGGTPLQHAVARGLDDAERLTRPLVAQLTPNRDASRTGSSRTGFALTAAALGPTSSTPATRRRRHRREPPGAAELPHRVGVVAIPAGAFHAVPQTAPTLVRFAFCKSPQTIAAAVERLGRL